MAIARFRRIIWDYYRRQGRDLPWRNTRNPYRILVSEVMLQQTQVSRVMRYYPKFLRAFPNFEALHRASLRDVLRQWQGLGYNRRALALKKVAATVVEKYGGKLPRDVERLKRLPGIGEATASAVAAFAWNTPVVFLETNVRSVLIHCFFPRRKMDSRLRGNDKVEGAKVDDRELLPLVERVLERRNSREWYWALMDYGSYLKTTRLNPGRRSSGHRRQTPFAGSLRELRGKILKTLLLEKRLAAVALARNSGVSSEKFAKAIKGLIRDGLAVRCGRDILIGNG